MEKEIEEKIRKLSWYSMYVGNCEEHKLMGIAEGVLEFTREEILKVCEDFYSFVIFGLAKSNKPEEIVNFMNEYLNGKFKYRNGTTSTIRFIHFVNYYMLKVSDEFRKTPFEMGNIFLENQKNGI